MFPFVALSKDEILQTSKLIRNLWPPATQIQFKVLTLHEPLKDEVLSFFEGLGNNGQQNLPERRAWVNYYLRNTVCLSVVQFAKIKSHSPSAQTE
jgi:primary-amine oxidase